MRLWLATLMFSIGLMAVLLTGTAESQGPGAGAAIAFRNDTKSPLIIQGVSSVGGMIRRGQPILVAPGRVAGDFNIPPGPRIYSVYDANQPSRVLAKDVPIMVPVTGAALFSVRALANNQVALVPEAAVK